MGFIEWLKNAGGDSEEDSGAGSTLAYNWNDIEVRADIIERHYRGVSSEQSQKIADILCSKLTEGGFSMRGIADEVMDRTGLSEERTFTIIQTESAAMQNLRRVQTYSEREDASEYTYQWMGPDDHRTTEICAGIKRDIESQGGAVSLGTLRSLIEKHAEQHENGTPERSDEFSPHRECRHTLTRHVDF